MMHWRKGMRIPVDGRRGLQEGDTPPVWYALTTPPQKEAAARAFLERQGLYAFYPNEERIRIIKGKRRARKAPIVGGYIFVQFTGHPRWHVIKQSGRFTGVLAAGDKPFVIPRGTILRLRGMTVEAAERRRELRELQQQLQAARMPKVGDKAKFVDGPFKDIEDFLVDVTDVRNGMVYFTSRDGIKGMARAATLERKS